MANTSTDTPKKVKVYASAIGRRKASIASVRIIPGKGEITVNNKPAADYFPGVSSEAKYDQPLKVAGVDDKYAVTVRVSGGGIAGQLDAMVLGISRALVNINEKFKASLRTAGLLTRDSRERERRKVGTGGKARRRKQSPKR